jgi:hypothetical protein
LIFTNDTAMMNVNEKGISSERILSSSDLNFRSIALTVLYKTELLAELTENDNITD